ncbi:MAG TPA: hypothetical protein VKZ47_07380 [Acidimicrobiia bacterium]|jgi:hypothetical protein|nr:hypothetical protein [Acidimicrobiia bacterium]
MGKFNASLRTLGDSRGVPATVTVVEERISIEAGDQEIGSWNIDEVVLEPTGESVYRLEVDGDRILIDFEDAGTFRDLLDSRSRMRSRIKLRGNRPKKPTEPKPAKAKSGPEPKTKEPKTKPKRSVAVTEAPAPVSSKKTAGRLDAVLTAAEERWGGLLPSWVFTRGTLTVLLIMVAAAFFVPNIVSLVLLIAGLLTVMFGAVVYTDTMLATRWLPGRMTPMHVLLFGVLVVLLGVLLGVIA